VLNKVGPFEGVFRFLPRRREDLIRGILGSAVEFEFEVTSVSLSKIVWEWVPATRIDMVANLIVISFLTDGFADA